MILDDADVPFLNAIAGRGNGQADTSTRDDAATTPNELDIFRPAMPEPEAHTGMVPDTATPLRGARKPSWAVRIFDDGTGSCSCGVLPYRQALTTADESAGSGWCGNTRSYRCRCGYRHGMKYPCG